MSKDLKSDERDGKIDELVTKIVQFDDICKEINLTLMAYRKLRFNELLRAMKKFSVKISKPTLQEHLNHLIDLGLIERKEEGFQNVSYSLTKEIDSLIHISKDDLKKYIELVENDEKLPEYLKDMKLSLEESYKHLSKEQLDEMAVNDLNKVLSLNLYELKTFIEYELKINKFQKSDDFWNFIGNPMYRSIESSITDSCRASEDYKRMLFEKIDILVEELRTDRELLRKRRESKKRRRK